jgi:RNA polymerase nonessential primary-like sigma factor
MSEDARRVPELLIGRLTVEQQRVLRTRFGLREDGTDGPLLSTRETAALLGLSEERVRRLEREALTRLRFLKD